ncbi:MAG: hypothetical protein IPM82_31105 [Saprospiraceae bacterium]|nr:hypothetical protein [Saprospiraceae bacterium]
MTSNSIQSINLAHGRKGNSYKLLGQKALLVQKLRLPTRRRSDGAAPI